MLITCVPGFHKSAVLLSEYADILTCPRPAKYIFQLSYYSAVLHCNIWGILILNCEAHKLMKLQDRMMRNLFLRFFPSSDNLYKSLNILKLPDIYKGCLYRLFVSFCIICIICICIILFVSFYYYKICLAVKSGSHSHLDGHMKEASPARGKMSAQSRSQRRSELAGSSSLQSRLSFKRSSGEFNLSSVNIDIKSL